MKRAGELWTNLSPFSWTNQTMLLRSPATKHYGPSGLPSWKITRVYRNERWGVKKIESWRKKAWNQKYITQGIGFVFLYKENSNTLRPKVSLIAAQGKKTNPARLVQGINFKQLLSCWRWRTVRFNHLPQCLVFPVGLQPKIPEGLTFLLHLSQFPGNLHQSSCSTGCICSTKRPRVSVVTQQH